MRAGTFPEFPGTAPRVETRGGIVRAWANSNGLQAGRASAFVDISDATFVISNAWWDGQQWHYQTAGASSLINLAVGVLTYYTAPAGVAGASVPFALRFYIDPNGQVGIGGVVPTQRFHVAGATSGAIFINDTGQLYGSALHNNSGSMTGTTNQYIGSGTYAPTVANANNTSTPTAAGFKWTRTGNIVRVTGELTFTPTVPATATTCTLTLPIASTLAANTTLNGNGNTRLSDSSIRNIAATIFGVVTSNLAKVMFLSADTSAHLITCDFSYEVL
jgi:hypothetical protein